MVTPRERIREILDSDDPVKTWHELSAGERESTVAHLRSKSILTQGECMRLEAFLRSKALDIVENRAVVRIIEKIKAGVHDTIPAPELPDIAQPEGKIVPLPSQKVPAIQEKPHPAEAPEDLVLSLHEIVRRFKKLEIDLPELQNRWAHFYNWRGYASPVGTPQYSLNYPEITEGAMQAFEEGFQEGLVDTLIFDDARLGDGSALRVLQSAATPTEALKKFNKSRHCSSGFLRQFVEGNIVRLKRTRDELDEAERAIIQYEFALSPEHHRTVRLVALKTLPEEGRTQKNNFEVAASRLQKPYTSLIDLGTWTRFLHYLYDNDPGKFARFLRSIKKGGGQSHPWDTNVLLNNISHDGSFATSSAYKGHNNCLVIPNFDETLPKDVSSLIPIVTIRSDWIPCENIPED